MCVYSWGRKGGRNGVACLCLFLLHNRVEGTGDEKNKCRANPRYIYIYKREVSVCLFVCLFGFGGQTTGWISTKFGMGHLLDPVGNLEILFLG